MRHYFEMSLSYKTITSLKGIKKFCAFERVVSVRDVQFRLFVGIMVCARYPGF